ncbi:MAG: hypothetical protein KKD44_18195 [Proteobacteria bacterium]|nr:hypothetical protein [Pseudomonadota bacterium]
MKGINPALAEGNDDFLIEMADQFRNEGYQQGMQKGLREGIELGLELRFGNTSLNMMTQVDRIQDVNKLEVFKDAIRHVRNPDELRDILGKL